MKKLAKIFFVAGMIMIVVGCQADSGIEMTFPMLGAILVISSGFMLGAEYESQKSKWKRRRSY